MAGRRRVNGRFANRVGVASDEMLRYPDTMRRLLLLETSHQPGLVGLAEDNTLVARRTLQAGRHHARDLAPAVAAILAECAWSPRQLDAVACSRGPGSYTGLRVGLITAKTLAYVTGCALVAIDTFALIAERAPSVCERLDVLADAQKEAVYVQGFQRRDGWQPADELRIVDFATWQASRNAIAWATGPGLSRHQPAADVPLIPEDCWLPSLEALLTLASGRLLAKQSDDPFAVEPLYLRPSSAELQWRGRPSNPA